MTQLHIHEKYQPGPCICVYDSPFSPNIKQLGENWLADAYLDGQTIPPGQTAARPYHELEATVLDLRTFLVVSVFEQAARVESALDEIEAHALKAGLYENT
jgi:hypothetical protein